MPTTRRTFMAASAILAGSGTAGALNAQPQPGDKESFTAETIYKISPIGTVRNKKGKPVQLELYEKYLPALHRLDECSHVLVIWWFHKNDTPAKRGILRVHPRGNSKNPLTGVFATHSPVRPNLIATTTCKILSVKGRFITIEGIDAFDGTPIIDLKSAGTRKNKLHPRKSKPKS